MSTDFGSLKISLSGAQGVLQEFNDYISCRKAGLKKLKDRSQCDPDEYEWNFLNCYEVENIRYSNKQSFRFYGDFAIDYHVGAGGWVEIAQKYAKEWVRLFPSISFDGVFEQDSGPLHIRDTRFFHIARSNMLWWYDNDVYSSRKTEYEWNADTDQIRQLDKPMSRYIQYCVDDVVLVFPLTIGIKVFSFEQANLCALEHVGDPLVLKACWNSEVAWPVAIEVYNAQGDLLGHLKPEYNDNTLVQLANRIDALSAQIIKECKAPKSSTGKVPLSCSMKIEIKEITQEAKS